MFERAQEDEENAYGGKIKYDGTNVAEDTDAAPETDAKSRMKAQRGNAG